MAVAVAHDVALPGLEAHRDHRGEPRHDVHDVRLDRDAERRSADRDHLDDSLRHPGVRHPGAP